ncbi:MAG: FHA domain-containing protein [Isosphaeraceae bacterium]
MDIALIQPNDYGDRVLPVADPECLIGRELTCNLRLEHGKISMRHCRIYRQGKRVMIEDLGSVAGTAVNGMNLNRDPAELKDGDDLRVGPWHFRVAIDDGSGSRATKTETTKTETPKATRPRLSPSDSCIMSPAVESAREILETLTGRDLISSTHASRPISTEPKPRLQVEEIKGVTMVRIIPRSLIDDAEIRRIDEDLAALINAGHDRMILCFTNVEQLSSQAIGSVIRAHRLCQNRGGQLKVCAPRSQVAEVFNITNLHRLLEVHADEAPALRSAWPPHGSARPKAETKTTLKPTTDQPPTRQPTAEAKTDRVRLRVMVGRARGQFIEVRAPRFLIGRDTRCQLRPNSEAVSRVHTVIEQREGRVFVRDCGTVNGTQLGDQTLHAEELEAKDGDRLQVGTLVFTVAIEDHHAHSESSESQNSAIAFLLDEHDPDPEAPTRYDLPTRPPTEYESDL